MCVCTYACFFQSSVYTIHCYIVGLVLDTHYEINKVEAEYVRLKDDKYFKEIRRFYSTCKGYEQKVIIINIHGC